ncbi:FAD-dependent monooxygenase [Macromonas nakdongensis]|uniref:FAD-dependent monooxygenase n=1 Tax=Macromonas nakdongensis TaxID=1843082 RepID=UPI000C340EF4|nr:FAD-dependent monooxygenase [Macromonas nakdongensis]
MSKKYDVAILGAGVVGQALALLLARDRLRVALVRREPAPTAPTAPPDIRAYALNASSKALLDGLRVWPGVAADGTEMATPVQHMWVAEDAPATPASVRFEGTPSHPLSWIVDVPALEVTLAQAVGFQSGIDVLAERPAAALTVVCEGKRSASRDAFGFEFDAKPYPQTAVAARLRTERPHGGVARQWFHQGEVLALLPLEGEHGQAVALVWSVAHERAAHLLALPPEALAAEVTAACDQALGAMQPQGQAAGWPLELSRARRWVQPGLALAGDAAHAMHPLAGQGLNVGLGDVAELARVLREREYWRDLGDLKLLRRYERARQADVTAMSWVTDGLLGLFGHRDSRIQALRRWGLRGFDRLEALKHWTVQQAMGPTGTAPH